MKRMLFFLIIAFTYVLSVNAQYKVGDYYEKNGVKGML